MCPFLFQKNSLFTKHLTKQTAAATTLMMTSDSISKPKRSKLKITTEDVVRIVKCRYELLGLEKARDEFDRMNSFFSTEKGWAETAKVIYQFFAEKRREEDKKAREEKLEQQRASASQFVVLNQANSTGIAKVEQVNGVVEEGAEVVHTKRN